MSFFRDKNVLVTGGTGSFGKCCVRTLLREHHPERIIVFSRDELKQAEFAATFEDERRIRFFIGDVRDKDRLYRAFHGVDLVIHAAALKQVPAAEYNPMEAIKTNIDGSANVIDAALDRGVYRVINLSTDKAVSPVNLYGATKLCAEKLFTAANSYAGRKDASFSVVRYGNVIASRGSVVKVFKAKKAEGVLPVTDKRMTRFFLTIEQAVHFVLECLEKMAGGEVFIPKIPSMKITDLAEAVSPGCQIREIGIRPGEKLHEIMITHDESRNALEFDSYYIIEPNFVWWRSRRDTLDKEGRHLPDGFIYSSDTNTDWLDIEQLRKMVGDVS